MQFELINTARSNRIVQGARGQVVVPPQTTIKDQHVRAELSETMAIALRRFQAKGSELHIRALDTAGESVLAKAEIARPQKAVHFNIVGNPPEKDEALKIDVEPDEIKDEIAEATPPGVVSLEQVEAAMRAAGLPPLPSSTPPADAAPAKPSARRTPTRGSKVAERAAKAKPKRVRLKG